MDDVDLPLRKLHDSSGNLLAIVFDAAEFGAGVSFVTPHDLQQQVAIMKRPSGETIAAHTHLAVNRAVEGTQEVLIILRGTMTADLYDNSRALIHSVKLHEGNVIVLVSGGHGFRINEDCDFVEVKQGPYTEGKDKEVFIPESHPI